MAVTALPAWKRIALGVLLAHLVALFGLDLISRLFFAKSDADAFETGPLRVQVLPAQLPKPSMVAPPEPFPGISSVAQQAMDAAPAPARPEAASEGADESPPASALAQRTPRPDELPGVGGVSLSVFWGDHSGNSPVAKGAIELSFPSEGRYQIRLMTKALGWAAVFAPNPLYAETVGRLGPGGFQPERYTHRSPRGREEVSVFDYEKKKIFYSSLKDPLPLPNGIQDRLSFMIQLAWMMKIEPDRFTVGESVLIPMAGRNKVENVNFTVMSDADLVLPGGVLVPAVHLSTYGSGERLKGQIDVWLDRTDRLMPVRIRFEESRGQVLDLLAVREP